jgi:sterol desaturase/sphingolipid hydroxylase (fatty acid hydroxylase superfamily)
VESALSWAHALRASWHALLPDPTLRTFAGCVVMAFGYYVLVMVIERGTGSRTDNYRSRSFAQDLVFYFYAKGGVPKLLLPTALIALLHDSLSFLDLRLLADLPYPAQLAAWLLIADCLNYWLHRAKHHFRFLWAFHTTHHSQARISFATYARVHPAEDITGQLLHVFTMLTLGADPISFFVIYLVLDAIGELSHTQIPWRLGPLYKVIVTPPFHAYHHSADAAHHDRNFASVFAFWDYLFGTAVPDGSPAPTRFGLAEVRSDSLLDALFGPFRLLYRYYVAPRRAALTDAAAVADAEPRTGET